MNKEKFWLNDPCVLISNLNFIPNAKMTNIEKLNALTRLLILISAGMFLLGYNHAFLVLALGILAILLLKSYLPTENFGEVTNKQALDKGVRGFVPYYDAQPHVGPNQACWFDQGTDFWNAAFERTPMLQFNHDDAAKRSYMNAKYELTPLTDTDGFRQIWRNEPDFCGGFSMVPDPLTVFPVQQPEAQGECNYIVRSKIDHLPISQGQNDLISTRPIVEQAWNDQQSTFREQMIGQHIDFFTQRRKHNCPDMKLSAGTAGAGGSI